MKKLLALLVAIAFAIIVPVNVLAAVTPTSGVDCSGSAASSTFCKERDANSTGNPLFGADGILTKAASILTIVTGIISMFIMTIAGLRFITSSGDPTKIESAKNAIIYSSIGLVVAIAGQAIVSLVLNNL
mgnify:CR=1 FL=1